MTDPSNVQKVEAIVAPDAVTALSSIGEHLWVGLKDGSIVISTITTEDEKLHLSPTHRFSPVKRNYMVHKILPIESHKCVIVHYTGLAGQPGPAVLYRSGDVRTKIEESATIVLTSMALNPPLIVTFNEDQFNVFTFKENVLHQISTHRLSYPVKVAAMCDESMVFYANSTYRLFFFKDDVFEDCPSNSVERPFAHAISSDRLFVGYKEFLAAVGLRGDKQPALRPYDQETGAPLFLYGDQVNFYQFYAQKFTRANITQDISSAAQVFDIKGVRFAAMLNQNLVVVTQNDIQIVGSIPPPKVLASMIDERRADEVYKIFSTLSRDQCAQELTALFGYLWKQYKNEDALNLATRFVWIGDIREVIALFPDIILRPPVGIRRSIPSKPMLNYYISGKIDPNGEKFYPMLLHFLEFQLEIYSKESDPRFTRRMASIKTSLAQVYALLIQTRKLDLIIKDQDNVDIEVLKEFVNKENHRQQLIPSRAVIDTRRGDVIQALAAWKDLNQRDPSNELYLDEAAFSLRKLRDSSKLTDYLNWLVTRKREAALTAILSRYHDPEVVLAWLKANKLDMYRLKYLYFVLTAPRTKTTYQLVSDATFEMIDCLNAVSKPNCNPNLLKWLEGKTDPKTEIEEKLITIFEKHRQSIEYDRAIRMLGRDASPRLLLCIYRVNDMYDESIAMLRKIHDEIPYEEIQEFCRKSPNTESAFSAFFKTLTDEDRESKQFLQFIRDNLQYLEIVEVMKILPKKASVKSLAEIVRASFALLEHRQSSLKVQIGVSRAVNIEAQYEKSRSQCRSCLIEEETKCATCGKTIDNVQFALGPDGTVYHQNCRPIH